MSPQHDSMTAPDALSTSDGSNEPFVLSQDVHDIARQLGEDVIGPGLMTAIRTNDLDTVKVLASFLIGTNSSVQVSEVIKILRTVEDGKAYAQFLEMQSKLRDLITQEVDAYLGI